MKIFVTGVYGSGKTFLAKEIAQKKNLQYVSFDDVYDYKSEENQYDRIMGELPEAFIIDAIVGTDWEAFVADEQKNNFSVICCYCPDKDTWLARVNRKPSPDLGPAGPTKESISTRLKRVTSVKILAKAIARRIVNTLRLSRSYISRIQAWWIKNFTEEGRTPPYFPPYFTNGHFSAYRSFYLNAIPYLERMRNVRYYDTITGEYTSLNEMKLRINLPLLALEERIFQHGYDTFYQDIEVLGIIGYSRSVLTWKRLEDIIDWRGKKVLDIGCFHGYFSFKIEEMMAKEVIGLEKSTTVLETARQLGELVDSKVEFREWSGGDDFPKCDVILFLNVIHHFGNIDMQRKALEKVSPGTQVIFEINQEQAPLVEELFKTTKRLSSHRKGRKIYLATRNPLAT